MIVYLNGEWLPQENARIPITDRGFLLADGVFETARLHQGRYFRLAQHFERLEESARTLEIGLPTRAALEQLANEIAARNQLTEGSLRITITRGSGGTGLRTQGVSDPTVLVTIAPMREGWADRAARGWSLITAKTLRPSPDSVPAQLKALGRVYSILAALEAERAGSDDALLLTANREI
ncbi:MAG TPA: aminotransferase class IV, partial [Longimicrobiales bacterium]